MEYVFEYTISVITFIQALVDSRHPESYKYPEKCAEKSKVGGWVSAIPIINLASPYPGKPLPKLPSEAPHTN